MTPSGLIARPDNETAKAASHAWRWSREAPAESHPLPVDRRGARRAVREERVAGDLTREAPARRSYRRAASAVAVSSTSSVLPARAASDSASAMSRSPMPRRRCARATSSFCTSARCGWFSGAANARVTVPTSRRAVARAQDDAPPGRRLGERVRARRPRPSRARAGGGSRPRRHAPSPRRAARRDRRSSRPSARSDSITAGPARRRSGTPLFDSFWKLESAGVPNSKQSPVRSSWRSAPSTITSRPRVTQTSWRMNAYDGGGEGDLRSRRQLHLDQLERAARAGEHLAPDVAASRDRASAAGRRRAPGARRRSPRARAAPRA